MAVTFRKITTFIDEYFDIVNQKITFTIRIQLITLANILFYKLMLNVLLYELKSYV